MSILTATRSSVKKPRALNPEHVDLDMICPLVPLRPAGEPGSEAGNARVQTS